MAAGEARLAVHFHATTGADAAVTAHAVGNGRAVDGVHVVKHVGHAGGVAHGHLVGLEVWRGVVLGIVALDRDADGAWHRRLRGPTAVVKITGLLAGRLGDRSGDWFEPGVHDVPDEPLDGVLRAARDVH